MIVINQNSYFLCDEVDELTLSFANRKLLILQKLKSHSVLLYTPMTHSSLFVMCISSTKTEEECAEKPRKRKNIKKSMSNIDIVIVCVGAAEPAPEISSSCR